MKQEKNEDRVQELNVKELLEKENNKRLYIIGNGFDLYHGLPTSYKCFNCFMCREHPEDHERIGRIFNPNDITMLWSDFENKLAELDVSELIYRNLSVWVKKPLHKFENEFDDLRCRLILNFQEWVKQINMACANSKRLGLDKTAYYLNFNYTETLECLYQIDEKQIFYIHNKICKDSDLVPVFGHGKNNSEVSEFVHEKSAEIKNRIIESQQQLSWENTIDGFEEEIVHEISTFLNDFRKKTNEIIDKEPFFSEREGPSFDEIFVLGHSLADVDLPYFEKIACKSRNAKWYVSYRDDNLKDLKRMAENVCKIPYANDVKFITLDELRVNGDNA